MARGAIRTIKRRLKEPSTWAGLAVLAAMFGGGQAAEAMQVIQGLAVIFSGAAIAMPEKSGAEHVE
jgi:hypothetical protein